MIQSSSQSSATTVAEITDAFADQGFNAQFRPELGGNARCFSCRQQISASELEVVEIQRTEGESDPDDMVAVVAARCGRCGASGTLSLEYGPESSPESAELLRLLPASS